MSAVISIFNIPEFIA